MFARRVREEIVCVCFFFSSRRRHTRCSRDWSSDVCSSDLERVIRATVQALLKQDYCSGRLEIIVINDGSTDHTGQLVEDMMAQAPTLKLVNIPAANGARGKARAVNEGLKVAQGDIIAVYDADNTPEPDALRLLVVQLLRHAELGAALGKFRTVNRRRNLLTRFINLETLAFQWITQAGGAKPLPGRPPPAPKPPPSRGRPPGGRGPGRPA